jgi:hypothetical protein
VDITGGWRKLHNELQNSLTLFERHSLSITNIGIKVGDGRKFTP